VALKSTDRIQIELTVDEFGSLIAALKKAEELSTAARVNELDFRMQRLRLESKFRDSVPPPPPGVEDTRMASLRDLVDFHTAITQRPPRG
jgi:hypothetical protein